MKNHEKCENCDECHARELLNSADRLLREAEKLVAYEGETYYNIGQALTHVAAAETYIEPRLQLKPLK